MSWTYPETLEEKQAAMARYQAAEAQRDGGDDPKVKKLTKAPRTRLSKADQVTKPAEKRRKKLTPREYRDKLIEQFRLQHLKPAEDLPAYDVTRATRYPGVTMWQGAGEDRLNSILKKHAFAMRPQGVTAGDIRQWRECYLMMTRDQLGALVRVTGRTVLAWESGQSEIPFSMWWVMHSTLQDPEVFLTRPGFHDFYIDYGEHGAELCSYTWPDIRVTPTDLYFQRTALNKVVAIEEKLRVREEEIGRLTAENTRLRQMLKTGAVTAELNAMHSHLGALLQQIHTADVVAFPEPASSSASSVVDFHRAANA